MGKGKTYVVFQGFTPGIYNSWESCREQVSGFKSATFRSFPTQEEAKEAYAAHLSNKVGTPPQAANNKDEPPTAPLTDKESSDAPEGPSCNLGTKRHRIEAILFRIQHDVDLIKNILDEA